MNLVWDKIFSVNYKRLNCPCWQLLLCSSNIGLFSAELLNPTGGFSPRCSNLSWAASRAETAGIEVRFRAGKAFILSYYLDPRISFTSFSRKEIPEIVLSLKTIKSKSVLPSWVLFILLLELLCILWECVVVWFWHSLCSSLKPDWYFISWKKAEDIPEVTFSCKVAIHLSVIQIKSNCVLYYLRLLIALCPPSDILALMKNFSYLVFGCFGIAQVSVDGSLKLREGSFTEFWQGGWRCSHAQPAARIEHFNRNMLQSWV